MVEGWELMVDSPEQRARRLKSASSPRPDFNRRKRREQRFSFPSSFHVCAWSIFRRSSRSRWGVIEEELVSWLQRTTWVSVSNEQLRPDLEMGCEPADVGER